MSHVKIIIFATILPTIEFSVILAAFNKNENQQLERPLNACKGIPQEHGVNVNANLLHHGVLVTNITQFSVILAAFNKNENQQLERHLNACKGIPQVKEYQENNKIGSKPDKNRKLPLRVVIPFRSSFGLVIVFPERVLEPEDEALPLMVEESGVDEEVGKPELDKLVLDKLEVGFDLGIKDYRNEKIDIRFRRECEDMIDELKGKFNGMSIEINKKKELLHLDANLEPEDSLIMGNEELSTILEKESDEFIKSSIKDLVLIPRESEDTSESDSECILPLCDDFSPINVSEENFVTFSNPIFYDDFTSSDDELLSDEDVSKENVKIYSNPFFEFDDEYISSDVNPLFDGVLEDIECTDSYDSNIDESTFLVTPLFDSNEDEYFAPGDDVELLLHHDPSTPMMSVVSIHKGFTDELPLEENDDLFDLESK
nr:hypothetical protein [Tanacetum cinerariifolium]